VPKTPTTQRFEAFYASRRFFAYTSVFTKINTKQTPKSGLIIRPHEGIKKALQKQSNEPHSPSYVYYNILPFTAVVKKSLSTEVFFAIMRAKYPLTAV